MGNVWIIFKRSDKTDTLKPEHTLRIDNDTLTMEWISDDHVEPVVRSMPELTTDQPLSQHILNVLNDDCLREIFLHLNQFDQYEVAHVCQRFRNVVLSAMPKHIKITADNCTPLWKLDKIIRIFGASIQTAYVHDSLGSDIPLLLLLRYCKNLVELNAIVYLEPTANQMGATFARLRRLELQHDFPVDILFRPNAQIESISVRYVRCLPSINFPNLRDFQVDIDVTQPPSTEQFFALNRHIEKLSIGFMQSYPPLSCLTNLLDLQELHVTTHWHIIADNVRAFGQMERLHTLKLNFITGQIMALLQTIVDNGIQLKRLTLKKHIDLIDFDVGPIIEMDRLEYLKLDFGDDIELARLVANCTNLMEIDMESPRITPCGIRDALKSANPMKKATFSIALNHELSRILVNQSDAIDAIAELRTNRSIDVRAIFSGYKTNEDIYEVSFN